MRIELHNIGKRYNYHWIIRGMNYVFESGGIYAVSGANGSGKSTLLKIISAYLSPSEGHVHLYHEGQKIDTDEVYQHISYAAPYMSIPTGLSIKEALRFVNSFKTYMDGRSWEEVYELIELPLKPNTRLSELSSGQLQRVHLVSAILVKSEITLLDEPGSYLDAQAQMWLMNLLQRFKVDRTVIIASNDVKDFMKGSEVIRMKG